MADAGHAREWRAVGLAALAGLGVLVASLGHLVTLDDWVWWHVLLARGCTTDALVDRIVDHATRGLIVLLALTVVAHVRRHGWRSAWPWVSACLLGLGASKTLKHVLTRERPSSLPDVALGFSFPSAHVMNSLVALLAIVVLAYGFRRRSLWWAAASLPAATIVVGRVLLGRHWTSDVVGGVLAALALVGLVVPAVARRPVRAPVALALVLATAYLVDARLGEGGLRLPAPLIGARTALIDVDVGSGTGAALGGAWRETDAQRPAGAFRWLDDRATLTIEVSDAAAEASAGDAAGLRLAFGARMERAPRPCMRVTVELNQRVLGRFIPFDGWREYRLQIPPGLLHAGPNEVAVAASDSAGPARVALSYLRVGTRSGAE